ncbi:MAG TPA: pyrroloquinoline quinone biosynthesis peptide chaperone PqqD [Streptosporangiaceae bacterium]|nr:pyrroloquinoline quinone biosynthesis peptide chaperone PqqD [Streptosporangiaceae bacterium]
MSAPISGRIDDADRPRLAPYVRLTFDPTREQHMLLAPETVSVLNRSGATILDLCDGRRTVADIVAELHERYAGVDGAEVRQFLALMVAKRCMAIDVSADQGADQDAGRAGDHG